MTKKVFIVGGGYQFASMYKEHGWALTDTISTADLVQLTGGEDIHPSIYGHTLHPETCPNIYRDQREIIAYSIATDLKKPISGVCRGAQLVNCLVGGTMWQDVDGHVGDHEVVDDETGEVWTTNSLHHQMMDPAKHAIWIAHSYKVCSYREKHINNDILRVENPFREPEVLYYEDVNALCFQGHPEMGGPKLRAKYFKYLDKYCY